MILGTISSYSSGTGVTLTIDGESSPTTKDYMFLSSYTPVVGDRVIIDRAVEPHDGSIVVAWWDGGFTMKFLDLTHRKDGYIELRPANPEYPVFKVNDPENFQIWGTVIHLIRTFEKI